MLNKLKHIIHFFRLLFKYNISASAIFCMKKDSVISLKAKLYEPYHIGNSKIGDYSYISKNANISYTDIGKYCSIGPNFLCGWGIHPTTGISTSPMFYSEKRQNKYSIQNQKTKLLEERKKILIGNDVFIGANVTILDGITIGDGAVIGAGAIVSKDIPPYAIAVGCPIKIIKYRFSQNIIESLLKIKWWNKDEGIHHDIANLFFDIEDFIEKHK